MKERFIPFEKLSKKKKKELNNLRRNTWGEFDPTTRVSESIKTYDRSKNKRNFRKEIRENS